MKILIIRFSPIDKIVLASPLLRCLRRTLPQAAIHFLTNDACRIAVEFNPNIDKLHVLAHSRELMIEEMRSEEYDEIIDLQNDSNSLSVSKALGKKPLLADPVGFWERIFSTSKNADTVGQYFKSVKPLGVVNDKNGLDYFIAAHEETKRADIPGSHYAGYIVCAIGADGSVKKWSLAKWKEFCSQLDHPIILIGNKDDAQKGNEIAAADDLRIYNACGKFSHNEMADLVGKAKLLVSSEKDLIQIAAAYKKPVVLITENRSAEHPYYGDNFLQGKQQPYIVLRNKNIDKVAAVDVLTVVKKWL